MCCTLTYPLLTTMLLASNVNISRHTLAQLHKSSRLYRHGGDTSNPCLLRPDITQAPRGLSAEEKRVKLLEIFHESVCSTARLRFGDFALTSNPERFFSGALKAFQVNA